MPPKTFLLRLYVAGGTPRSIQAIRQTKALCESRLHDDYELEVIDLYQRPERACEADIIALPTLIKHSPGPMRQVFGDLSAPTDELVQALGIDLDAPST